MKPKVYEICPNCGERQAELDGDTIRVAHTCDRTHTNRTESISVNDADFVSAPDRG